MTINKPIGSQASNFFVPLQEAYPVTSSKNFSLRTLGASTELVSIDHLSLLRVQGEDAESFLQGQFSNNVLALDYSKAQLHAYCNPKGRALAVFRIMRMDQGFWMILPNDLCETICKRLRMFVLRAKVSIETESEFSMIGSIGVIADLDPGLMTYSLGDNDPRQLIIGSSGTMDTLLSSQCVLHSDTWRLADILAGYPQVFGQTSELFIPQNINLDLVDGVSFKKGCYPGQEIIARIRYLGKSKQRMMIATAQSPDQIKPADALFTEDKPDQKSGMVVDAVKTDDETYHLSAMVSASLINTDQLRIGSASGPILHNQPLPYEIPTDC